MRNLHREYPAVFLKRITARAERDWEETYRTWLLSSVSEPAGKGATGAACYSGRVSAGTR